MHTFDGHCINCQTPKTDTFKNGIGTFIYACRVSIFLTIVNTELKLTLTNPKMVMNT